MCFSTGICRTNIDQTLVELAADLPVFLAGSALRAKAPDPLRVELDGWFDLSEVVNIEGTTTLTRFGGLTERAAEKGNAGDCC